MVLAVALCPALSARAAEGFGQQLETNPSKDHLPSDSLSRLRLRTGYLNRIEREPDQGASEGTYG